MRDTTIYRVISKKENTLKVFKDLSNLGAWLLGRYIDDCIFLKEDRAGVRIIDIKSSKDVSKIEFELEIG